MRSINRYGAVYPSPIGNLTVLSDGEALSGLWFEGQAKGVTPPLCPSLAVFQSAFHWLDRYFAGERPSPMELPYRLEGTDFRVAVWKTLLRIPYGTLCTYGQIARALQKPIGASRAVGGAVGQNPLPVLLPCHRVIGADASLTGFGGGLEIKTRLLQLEGFTVENGFVRQFKNENEESHGF